MCSQTDISLHTAHTQSASAGQDMPKGAAPELDKGGFLQSKTSPFHLKVVTKVVLHNGAESNWVGLIFLSVRKALNGGSCSAT